MGLSKNKVKWITSLQIKKFRQNYHKFPVEGDKIVRELLLDGRWHTDELYGLPEWIDQHTELISKHRIEVVEVSAGDLRKLSAMQAPQQVLAIVDMHVLPRQDDIIRSDLSLYLDGIQDPGNLGAILRIADWFGIRHVFLSPESVEVFNPKVIQASMGAFLRVCTEVCELGEIKTAFPDLKVWGADLEGENVFAVKGAVAGTLVVVGNEGGGITPSCQELLEGKLTVPKQEGAGTESLNAAVATGIIVAALRNKSVV